ncbi:MAG: NB-ARC domain-containing protein [Nostoc sp.]|uniref:NB-ARC domain-containing protein n=1 Tax=Nostoc sp. TaxID=1180 RepID=UPI002FF97EA7
MPREPTKGPVIQKRVKRLLEALLCFIDGEFEDGNFKIEFDWKEADSANPKLTVQTTLVTLELLTQKDKYPGKLTKAQIREALNLLKDFLKILEDNRLQTQGVENWHFTVKLWSRNKEKNLKRFDEVWENNRPQKSKTLEANFQQDDGKVQDLGETVKLQPQINQATENYQGLNIKGGNSTINNVTFNSNQISNAVQQAGKPFQAPPLPEHFVERPEYSNDLKTRLITESSSNHTLIITAIHGLGSVGKSTLAAALAHNAEIQSRFCDGILWATLGQQPNVLALLSGWVQALGDYSFKPTSVEATSSHLRTLLYDKAVLLVVDDAWNTEDAQAFNFGGARCQVLVTTREGHIADALAASTYSLDIMKPDQAMELLTKKLRREITGIERHSAENLAKGVGYLPLALELAAAEVACGTTWNELLADIQQEVARLTSFDRPEAEEITDEASLKRLSLTASLNLSVKRMPPEKQQHFSWLGVLPEDVNINKMMAATLWQMDKRDAAKMLQYLRNKALKLLDILPEALAAARAIQDKSLRADAFSALAEKLPPELLPEALAAARGIQDEDSRADALSALAEKLPDILPEALAAARAIQNEFFRANTLSALAEKLPDILPEALAAARAIQYEYSRANALSALAKKLPPELLPEALAAARAIQDKDYRANVLSALASGLSQMPTAELFSLWQDILHELSLRTRSNLLRDIKALFPVIFALSGEAATAEIACAIFDVARWWK